MPSFTQAFRIGRLLTPLPENTLVLQEFSGTEFINDISSFRVRAVAADGPVDLDKLLGQPMTVDFKALHGDRWFNLTVFSARYLGNERTNHFYDFELRPWIWAMSRRETSRIFHKKTVKEIIAEVLGDYTSLTGAAHEFHIQTSMPKLEYTVQYRETDLNFVRRLLEEFGINFHMKMDMRGQTLVMSDNTDGFVAVAGPVRPFVPNAGHHESSVEHIHTWLAQRTLTTGAVRLTDYDFKRPTVAMEVTQKNDQPYVNSSFESYDYPGRYIESADGKSLAKRRLDGFRSADATVRADGNLLSLGAGMMFTLRAHEQTDQNGKYVCLSAHHHFVDGGYRSGGGHSASYDGYFALTKESSPIAPERITPRSVVRGPQTAVVTVGADSAVDKWGRINVKFHWDTYAQSMPCRVSQMWSGPSWGTVFIPRVGMEVIVEFLEGDPDRPIVVGCVYNETNMPPYPLPDDKEISGIKSQTMGGSGYNEFIFDDTAGKELIRMHGQKDLEVTIENDETHVIKHDSKHTITGNRTDKIGENESTTVSGDRTVTVTGTETTKVTKKIIIASDAEIEIKVGTSVITITPTGIKIAAVKIEVLASAMLETNGSATAKHTAGGVLQIQSPLVTIN